MAELADAPDLGSGIRKGVGVRIPSGALCYHLSKVVTSTGRVFWHARPTPAVCSYAESS